MRRHTAPPVGLHRGASHLQLDGQACEEAAVGHVEVVLPEGLRAPADGDVHQTRGGRGNGEPEASATEETVCKQSHCTHTTTSLTVCSRRDSLGSRCPCW